MRYALGVSGSCHILDTQVLGLTQRRQTHLDGCRAMWTNRMSVGTRTPPPGTCAQGLLPSHIEEDRLRTHLWMPVFPSTAHPYTCPASPYGRSALEQVLLLPGRQLQCGKQRCIWPRAACGWKSQGHAHGGHLHRQRIRRSPDLWWRPDCQSR